MVSEADVKTSALKDYAKLAFDNAVQQVTAESKPVDISGFTFHGDAKMEKLPDGSFKWTIDASDAVQKFIQAELEKQKGTCNESV